LRLDFSKHPIKNIYGAKRRRYKAPSNRLNEPDLAKINSLATFHGLAKIAVFTPKNKRKDLKILANCPKIMDRAPNVDGPHKRE
jgi:hypothetical protein